MDKLHLKPYTFRGRVMWALYTAAIISCLISLVFAYFFTHLNVQSELKIQQQTIAVYLLEMEKRTELPLNDILYLAQQDDFSAVPVPLGDPAIPAEVQEKLLTQTLFTQLDDVLDMPVTYVRMQDCIVRIDAAAGVNLYFVAFFRVITSSLSYLAVIVLMITFVTFHMTKPFHALTAANLRVQEGDFDVRLPEDVPGEMGELMRSFNDMTESLGKTAYLQKDFISSISHEFKTPIASIRGFAKLLQMPGLSEEQRAEYIDLIARESDRLSRLSETLLRLTALEQQTAPASLSSFSVDEQLRQVILRLEPTWSSRDIGWQLDLEETVTIESDEALLSHVWINLIQNAMKFSPNGSDIEVSAALKDGKAVVSIRDHGCGMDEATLSRIFDRFYQADGSRSQEGVGLGLCLVKRILDMLGGTVEVESAPDEGSTFRVTLPQHPPRHTRTEGQLNA